MYPANSLVFTYVLCSTYSGPGSMAQRYFLSKDPILIRNQPYWTLARDPCALKIPPGWAESCTILNPVLEQWWHPVSCISYDCVEVTS